MTTLITLLRDYLRSIETIQDILFTLIFTGLFGLFITGWTTLVVGFLTGTIPVPQF